MEIKFYRKFDTISRIMNPRMILILLTTVSLLDGKEKSDKVLIFIRFLMYIRDDTIKLVTVETLLKNEQIYGITFN